MDDEDTLKVYGNVDLSGIKWLTTSSIHYVTVSVLQKAPSIFLFLKILMASENQLAASSLTKLEH